MRYLTILCLTFSSLAAPLYAQDSGVTATAYQTVNVRSGPGTQYDVIGQLSNGDTAPVLGRDSETTRWLYIAMPGSPGEQGWVAAFTVTTSGGLDSLEIEGDSNSTGGAGSDNSSSEEGVMITAFGRVNVRSGPGIDYAVSGQLEVADEAQATARSNYNNDWLYIENDKISGWVAYFTVTVRGNTEDLPVLVPDTVDGELVPPSTLITANFNVQLHSRPAFSAPSNGVIPFESKVSPVGKSASGRWIYVAYDGAEGWAWAGLFEITSEQLAQIPPRSTPTLTLTQTPTPTPTATATSIGH